MNRFKSVKTTKKSKIIHSIDTMNKMIRTQKIGENNSSFIHLS